MIRTYARIAAVVLVAIAGAGLVALGWSVGEVFYHLGLGLLFGYAGFLQGDAGVVRLLVGGLGMIVIAIKAAEFLVTWSVPAIPFYMAPHEITCAVVGISAVLAARCLPEERRGSGHGRREP